ncbi:bifunctional peptidase and arginyl-hydroxylase JMJD5 [Bombyx mori]|uniref:JmjC domain-containing protein n=1 Tax=Bombyx mori TaxID=7091 RepID=A0A8R2HTP1_BOMMO|nr:bifunctional peptidase and arginyl-hydroxylase JMJD5 [Bombyx mori]
MSDVLDLCRKFELFLPNVELSLSEVIELDGCTKSLLNHFIKNPNTLNQRTLIKIQAIIDYMHEKINIGNWKDVKLYLRKTITISSYLKLLIYWKDPNNPMDDLLKESYKIIDFGLVFGCPIENELQLLQKCAGLLNPYSSDYVSEISTNTIKLKHNEVNVEPNKCNTVPVDVMDCPSMESFYTNRILKEKPVVLINCMNNWPALTKWNDQNYFLKMAGLRTVAVELGSKYTDSDWTQKLMTVEEFIKDHIYQSNGPKGYLAQYQLFDQIPELKADIIEPEYCCFAETENPIDVMAWYGPKGTVSPLHHDPKKNLLSQVVGEKQIYLFPPSDSKYLYPHDHELLSNTAKVDPREPNYEIYPEYRHAKAYYCKLKPGQMLFIPPKWWHFVESLSISFSVSFWWD